MSWVSYFSRAPWNNEFCQTFVEQGKSNVLLCPRKRSKWTSAIILKPSKSFSLLQISWSLREQRLAWSSVCRRQGIGKKLNVVVHFVDLTLCQTLSNGAKDTKQEPNLIKKLGIWSKCRVIKVKSRQSGTRPNKNIIMLYIKKTRHGLTALIQDDELSLFQNF